VVWVGVLVCQERTREVGRFSARRRRLLPVSAWLEKVIETGGAERAGCAKQGSTVPEYDTFGLEPSAGGSWTETGRGGLFCRRRFRCKVGPGLTGVVGKKRSGSNWWKIHIDLRGSCGNGRQWGKDKNSTEVGGKDKDGPNCYLSQFVRERRGGGNGAWKIGGKYGWQISDVVKNSSDSAKQTPIRLE